MKSLDFHLGISSWLSTLLNFELDEILMRFNGAFLGQLILVWPRITLIQTLVYQLTLMNQLSSFLEQEQRLVKAAPIQTHVYKQLSSTLINSHSCLTRSKESQDNSHTNSCLQAHINCHPVWTENKELKQLLYIHTYIYTSSLLLRGFSVADYIKYQSDLLYLTIYVDESKAYQVRHRLPSYDPYT